jgi:hypothetical protein
MGPFQQPHRQFGPLRGAAFNLFTEETTMRGKWVGVMAAGGLIGFSAIAVAQTQPSQTPGVDARQEIQQKRIEQGVQSGALTGREAARMDRQQDRIEANKQKALQDGQVTPRERAKLHRQQDRASRHIYHQKHDRQRRATN